MNFFCSAHALTLAAGKASPVLNDGRMFYFHFMKKWWVLLLLAMVMASCNRNSCPAYSGGSITGAEGSGGKAQQLFPKEMQKKKN
jgi:hypothetical protein